MKENKIQRELANKGGSRVLQQLLQTEGMSFVSLAYYSVVLQLMAKGEFDKAARKIAAWGVQAGASGNEADEAMQLFLRALCKTKQGKLRGALRDLSLAWVFSTSAEQCLNRSLALYFAARIVACQPSLSHREGTAARYLSEAIKIAADLTHSGAFFGDAGLRDWQEFLQITARNLAQA